MNRFGYKKQALKPSGFLFSVCIFLLILFLFVQGISSFSESTKKRQKESLENAIMRNITYCYTDLFFVDYRISGSNILPDVTIIEREGK